MPCLKNRRRMEKRIFITLPNQSQIKTLLELNLKASYSCLMIPELPSEELRLQHSMTKWQDFVLECDLRKLAADMEAYSGVDVFNVCRDAAMNRIREVLTGRSLEMIRDMHTMRLLRVTDSDFAMV